MVACIGMTGVLRGQGTCKDCHTPKAMHHNTRETSHGLPKESLGGEPWAISLRLRITRATNL